jgi:glycerol-3-phosphate cytidylyltransferase
MNNLPKKVGFNCSAMDLFHAGHVTMLREEKRHCDYLIVALQYDPTIDRPDTKNKPVQSIYERWTQVSACKYVDEVVIYTTEKELEDILKTLPIDIRILGEEYMDKEFTGKEICLKRGIRFHYNKRDHSFSSTDLRKRVFEAEATKRGVTWQESNITNVSNAMLSSR